MPSHFLTLLGALSIGGVAACATREKQATEVPAPTSSSTKAGECLHSEGCCGGHTKGDASCGAANKGTGAEPSQPMGPAKTERFEWTLLPGQFAEINLELGDGVTTTASFTAEGALAWNVHSHPGDTPVIHAEGTDARGAPAFTAEKAGLYSYLWANRGDAALKLVVELRIGGTGRVHSTHP